MQTYNDIKQANQERVNNFEGLFFAFSNTQLGEGLAKFGLTMEDTNQIVSIGAGGYLLKTRVKAFTEMMGQNERDLKNLRKEKKLLLDALVYELRNHEYCITGDMTDALAALGLKFEDVPSDILKKAHKLTANEG